MPRFLPAIPSEVTIVDNLGRITTFFRLQWQALIDSSIYSPNVSVTTKENQTDQLPIANAYVTKNAAWYRINYSLHKTIADGVSSSLIMTIGWTDHGFTLSHVFTPLSLDTIAAEQSGSILVYADADSAITFAVAYASHTANKMAYSAGVIVEIMA